MKPFITRRIYLAIASVILIALVAACSKPTQTPITQTSLPTVEATIPATAIPASLLVLDPTGAATQDVQDSLQGFASSNGLNYRSSSEPNPDYTGVKMVVAFMRGSEIKEQVSKYPEIQFLFIGNPDIESGGNVSLLRNKLEDLAFMAGYLATVTAEDWRSGGLLSSSTLGVDMLGNAFTNGGAYECGVCTPLYPPYMNYPVYQDVSGKTSAAEMMPDVEALNGNVVDTAFISQSADFPEVLDALQTEEVTVIGEKISSADHARYAAILGYDEKTALTEMLPKLLAGEGGQNLVSRVVILEVNDSLKITPGRQDLFNQAAEKLVGGWIIPLSVP